MKENSKIYEGEEEEEWETGCRTREGNLAEQQNKL